MEGIYTGYAEVLLMAGLEISRLDPQKHNRTEQKDSDVIKKS